MQTIFIESTHSGLINDTPNDCRPCQILKVKLLIMTCCHITLNERSTKNRIHSLIGSDNDRRI